MISIRRGRCVGETRNIGQRKGADALVRDIQRMCLRIDRAATVLEWSPQIGLAEGIAALAPAKVEASA